MRVLVCGDRNWTDGKLIEKTILDVHLNDRDHNGQSGITHIISGEARGADTLAKTIAHKNHFKFLGFPALWNQYGKAAGPIRNQQMLDEGEPDFALAFHDDLEHSKGTKDMLERINKAGLPYRVITHRS